MTKLRVLQLGGQKLNSELPLNMSSFLTHLDLGNSEVRGMLPETIFEKQNLKILNLCCNYGLEGSLPESLNWSNVHFITQLALDETGISGRVPDSIGVMSNIEYMALSNCKFSGQIPESIGNFTGITLMDWNSNEFSGPVPSIISSLRHLTHLDLSFNHLEGQLPDTFSGFDSLTILKLNGNHLAGQIPSSLTNMSRLTELDISSNALSGHLPNRAGHGLHVLETMDLSNNSIQGTIPSWLFTLPSLDRLHLALNRLTGPIGKIDSDTLNELDLSFNRLNIDLNSFHSLTNIQQLLLSHNTITEHDYNKTRNFSIFPILSTLEMSSCNIEEFPNLLMRMPVLNILDLSVNKIHGPIPTWFSSISQDLYHLDLSANFLTSVEYLSWKGLQSVSLRSNLLQGKLPSSLCNMTWVSYLNLSKNKLSGNIPECIGNFSDLSVLDLTSNEFDGKIPSTIGHYNFIHLALNDNHVEGQLPRSLANCTSLEVFDVGNNMIQGTFPSWLENLTILKVLILKSNRFHGSISPPVSSNSFSSLQIIDLSHNSFTCVLPQKLFARLQAMKKQDKETAGDLYMQSNAYYYSTTLSVKGKDVELTRVLRIFTFIDLSSNNFQGAIPESISHLTVLRLLNLSHNCFSGTIPPALGRMTNLEQLDLSSNQLTGRIPQVLTNLTFLEVLNVSHNHLVGPIPQSNQFPTFSNDSYAGNLGLCGAPLTSNCGDERESPSEEEEEAEDFGFMTGLTWKTVVIGYACGILLGFISGNVMISAQKPKWLTRFVYTEAAIILERRKKRSRAARMVLLGQR